MADAVIPTIPTTGGGLGNLQALANLLPALFGQNQSTSTETVSPEGLDSSMQVIMMLMQELLQGDFSQGAADADSAKLMEGLFKQILEGNLPGINGAEAASGGYNSTTAALMRNDLRARMAAEGAKVNVQLKNQYANNRNAQVNSLIQAINAAIRARQVQNTNQNKQGALQTPAGKAAAAMGAAQKGAGMLSKMFSTDPIGRAAQQGEKWAQDQAEWQKEMEANWQSAEDAMAAADTTPAEMPNDIDWTQEPQMMDISGIDWFGDGTNSEMDNWDFMGDWDSLDGGDAGWTDAEWEDFISEPIYGDEGE